MTILTDYERSRIAAYLARVVPHGPDEADELERLVLHLSRRALPRHDGDLMG